MIGRVIVLLLFSFLGGVLFLTALCGREYVVTRDDRYLASHKVCAVISFILMIVAVGGVELLSLFQGPIGSDPLLAIHLSSAIPFFMLFVLSLFFLTGVRVPRYHRLFVYPCLLLFVIAFVPGAAMLLDLKAWFSF